MELLQCISQKQVDLLNSLDLSSVKESFISLCLPEGRHEIFLDVIQERVLIDPFTKLDIQQYALKHFFPQDYKLNPIKKHSYSETNIYEYDPAKNGQNIIKHGLSFREVVSYSNKFGTLLVPCPDQDDSTRYVIFSDLSLSQQNRKLDLPLNNSIGSSEVYILSIAQSVNDRFRFISSRIMSSKKFDKNMKNAFRGIYADEPEKKKEFVSHCVSLLKRDLLK